MGELALSIGKAGQRCVVGQIRIEVCAFLSSCGWYLDLCPVCLLAVGDYHESMVRERRS